MKKIIVLKTFVDREDESISYAPGQLLEFEDDRADNLIKRGLTSLDDSEEKAAAAAKAKADADAKAAKLAAEKKAKAEADAKKELDAKTEQK